MLSTILLGARRCNARDGITGALVCRHDVYLQLLEGPGSAVQAAYERIRQDDRHLEVKLRVSRNTKTPLFAHWAMLHDPANSWIWSTDEISNDILERASKADFIDVFERLAAKVQASA